MAKIKLGDTVKILKSTYEGEPHEASQEYVGKIGKVVEIDESYDYPYDVKVMGLGIQSFEVSDLRIFNGKEPKVNFLLQYELDEDPIEEFETEKEIKERIKELSEKRDLKQDSIVVYDVSRVRRITLRKETVIEGL